ncbi:hypothetical protein Pmani_032706 [Petrolisthes manimaculis]|uniref:Uncharacterized protein n=1 Tax=Petrolisthes manimaculis TaxID=1843537 RepID=A0AAE1NT28_9EUCA|nr:hypothetical protein Pmani_032706 [Petrolisthes manimaculis]
METTCAPLPLHIPPPDTTTSPSTYHLHTQPHTYHLFTPQLLHIPLLPLHNPPPLDTTTLLHTKTTPSHTTPRNHNSSCSCSSSSFTYHHLHTRPPLSLPLPIPPPSNMPTVSRKSYMGVN